MRQPRSVSFAGKPSSSRLQRDESVVVIRPVSGWFDLHLADLWRYRDLVLLFVRRDFVAVYKQTILGPIWFLLQPLLTTVMFTLVFGRLAGIPTDGVPPFLFYMSGVVPWNYFAGCLNQTSNTFVANASLFGKVWFPRLTVPVAAVLNNLITFAIQFVLFAGFYVFFVAGGVPVAPTWTLILLPLLVIQLAALGLGCGIIVSSLTTKYRDLVHLVTFGVQLWMYATPVVYPASRIPDRWKWIVVTNPLAPLIEQFRHAVLGTPGVGVSLILTSVGVTLVLLLAGLVLFSRIEKSFVDTV